ncbi:universal stress protein [Candidatus Laterigemmans baculatus]|uniref:universal stress protein n=1 Tax=Candidatus Laterigemmans baculatus TaxID=2770505 RepID=UPI0013DC1578|nr:universal stress protein [Candidatus Laterigemmans baculatus]
MDHFSRILLYTGTDNLDVALSRSVQLAIENGATLTLMDVVRPVPRGGGMISDLASADELEREVVAETRERLLQLASEYSDTGVTFDVVVAIGKPAVEIIRQVIRGQHDLVVKTASGRRPLVRLFGSVMTALLRDCPCPVWALKPDVHGAFDCVLAAVDPEAEDEEHRALNLQILELALAICRREDAVLHLVGVWDLWMEPSLRRRAGDAEIDALLVQREQELRAAFEALLEPLRTATDRVELHIRRGVPAETIRTVADEIEADLMVLGTVCRSGVAGFLIGNTAEQVLAEATCSVLAVKPEGYVSPVTLEAGRKP